MGNLTHTVSGDIASFRSAARVPIESLKCHFKPKLDLHGYDRPWPAGGGKNLFNSIMVNGNIDMTAGTISLSNTTRLISDFIFLLAGTYTFSLKENKLVTIYFYTSADTTTYVLAERLSSWEDVPRTFTISENRYAIFVLRNSDNSNIIASDVSELLIEVGSSKTSYAPYSNICPIEGWNSCEIYRTQNLWDGQYEVGYINSSGQEITGSSTRRSVGYIPVKPSSLILIIYTKHPNNTYNILIFQYKADKTYNSRSTWIAPNGTYNIHTDTAYIRFTMDANYTSIYTKGNLVIFYPSLKTAIPITFPILGKNKFNYNNANIINNKRLDDTGEEVTDASGSYCKTLIPVIPNTTYTLSGYTENNVSKRIYYIDKNLNFISRGTAFGGNSYTFITPNNCYYCLIQNREIANAGWETLQLELGDTATTYEPYNSNNTVYGGYVDIAAGEIVATYSYYTLDGTETKWTVDGSGDSKRAYTDTNQLKGIAKAKGKLYCNYCKTKSGQWYGWISSTGSSTSCHILFYIPLEFDTSAKWRAYLAEHPMDICYELNEPIHYPLSKTELKTFLDQNNFWSNTNDITEVSYLIHDSNMIQSIKKEIIAGNAPHIEMTSDIIANFSTDMVSNIKNAKIYINPILDIHGLAIAAPILGKNLLNVSFNNKFGPDTFIGNTIERGTGIIVNPYSAVNGGYWVKIKPNTTYTYSFNCTYSGSCLHARVWCFAEKPTSTSFPTEALVVNKTSFKNSETFTTPADSEWALVGLYAYSYGLGSTLTNMQLEEGNIATTYEPYLGNFPITGISEVNVYSSGINLLPAEEWSKTQNGLTFTYHSDGSIHIEGQWEKNTWLNIPESFYFKIPQGTYTLSGNTAGYDNTGILLYLLINGKDIAFADNGTSRTITTNGGEARIQVGAYKNYDLNVTIYPQLERSSTISSFEPNKFKKYIISLPRLGKNFYNATSVTKTQAGVNWIANNDYTITVQGIPTDYSMIITGVSEIPSSGNICLSANFNELTNVAWDNYYIYNSNMELLTSTGGGGTGYKVIDLDTYIDPKYIRLSFKRGNNNITVEGVIKPMIEVGTSPTIYEPYNILYGGYIDLITGQLVQTHKKTTVSQLTWRTVTTLGAGGWATASLTPTDMSRTAVPISNIYIPTDAHGSWSQYLTEKDYSISRYSPSDNLAIVIKDTRYETVADFIAALGNTEIIYELSTPITYQLDPTVIKTIRGMNNIWSNTNNNIEVQYWTH